MISLCPVCKIEQMVTAIALQENRGVVHCEACAEPFKPRAHRVTPVRERAFKQRLKEAQPAMAAAPEAALLAAADYGTGEAGDREAGDREAGDRYDKQDHSNAGNTDRLIEELGGSMNTLNNPIGTCINEAADVLEENKSLLNSEPETLAAQSSPKSKPSGASEHAKKPSDGEPVQQPSKTLSPEKIQRQRLRKARQAIARQKLVLEYEKLKVESEKLEFEKKKLELEKVKFEIMAKHKLLEVQHIAASVSHGPALDGRPMVEYDIKRDLLPRTPNAIDRVGQSTVKNREKVHLELLPNEPGRLLRKNLSSKSKNTKAK